MGLPIRNAELLEAIKAASAKITATPEDYGLTAEQATALAGKVTGAENAMKEAAKFKALKEPKTQAAKTALGELEQLFRSLQRQARFNPEVTNEKLADIGASRKSPPSQVGAPDPYEGCQVWRARV